MFYNVENLFDTINSTTTKDSEFLPNGEKKWNTYRYNYKLNQLAKVFSSIKKDVNNNKLPNIIGLCEVENELVIKDLLKDTVFNNQMDDVLRQKFGDDISIVIPPTIDIVHPHPNSEHPS